MNKKIACGLSALTVIASLLIASSSHAAIRWDLKPAGTGDFDWRLSGLYSFYEQGADGVFASRDFNGMLWANAAPVCLDISTGQGHYTSNPDTRIWAKKQDGTWISINDDTGGTVQSRARIWIKPYGNPQANPPVPLVDLQYFLNIRPWDPAGNFDDWQVLVTRRDLTEAQCAPEPSTSATVAWAKFIGTGTNTYTMTPSPNHT
jgi:hypothetical protein